MGIKSLTLAALLCVAVPMASVACSTQSAEKTDVGQLKMALTTTSSSGNVYRLSSAVFDIAGPTAAQIVSDDFPNQTAAIIDLSEGAYTSTLAEGWVLQRQTPQGFVGVDAVLRSASAQAFEIIAGEPTPLVYVFRTDGDEVVFGEGSLELSIVVEESPAEWTCQPEFYDAADGCDCDCGVVDPDCSLPDQQVYGCDPGQTCSGEGLCEGGYVCGNGIVEPGEACDDGNNNAGDGCSPSCLSEALPPEWTCRPDYYDAADGCDCACGAVDPDCDIPGATVFNCGVNGVCTSEGLCENTAVCGNGVVEPGEGCDDGNTISGDGCSATCVNENIPAGWTCNASYYDAADGCDCACGAPDPDCELPDQDLYNCSEGEVCTPQGECVLP